MAFKIWVCSQFWGFWIKLLILNLENAFISLTDSCVITQTFGLETFVLHFNFTVAQIWNQYCMRLYLMCYYCFVRWFWSSKNNVKRQPRMFMQVYVIVIQHCIQQKTTISNSICLVFLPYSLLCIEFRIRAFTFRLCNKVQ